MVASPAGRYQRAAPWGGCRSGPVAPQGHAVLGVGTVAEAAGQGVAGMRAGAASGVAGAPAKRSPRPAAAAASR